MKAAALAFALGAMITVEQRDRHRSLYDPPSAAISTKGRFVAFTTYSRLVSADTNDLSDVYVLDRARLDVTLESAGGGQPQATAAIPASAAMAGMSSSSAPLS